MVVLVFLPLGFHVISGTTTAPMLLLLLLLSHFSRIRLCATHRQHPTRLPHPWDSPGKNTRVGGKCYSSIIKLLRKNFST